MAGTRRKKNKTAEIYNKSLSVIDNKKMCSECNTIKALNDFSKDSYAVLGVCTICKDCSKNKREPNKEINNIRHRNRRNTNLEKYRRDTVFRNYKIKGIVITEKEYDQLHTKQEGKCAICSISEKDYGKKLALDHDHKTGKIRGFLCSDCNIGLGKFRDSITSLENAVKYLKNNG